MERPRECREQEEAMPAGRPGRAAASWRRTGRAAGRAGLVASLLLGLVSVAEGQAPNIQGTWEIEYKFVEMKGNKNDMNACKGPFPYSYTWQFDICQPTDSNEFTALIAGADAGTTRTQPLVEGTPDNVIQRCQYRPSSLGPAGDTQNWAQLDAPGYPSDTLWQTYKPKDEQGRQTEPRTFKNFHLPVDKPYLWGQICFQYDWQDTAQNQAGFKYYDGAWRHENETWVFVREACNCNSQSDEADAQVCQECTEPIPGTALTRIRSGCLESIGYSEANCPLSLVGVSGGTVLYPEETTGVQPLLTGEDRLCYMYSEIRGTLLRTADQVAESCRSSTATAGEGSTGNVDVFAGTGGLRPGAGLLWGAALALCAAIVLV